jgi:uncharacterized protein (DUF885 family)
MKRALLLAACLSLLACPKRPPVTTPPDPTDPHGAAGGVEDGVLAALLTEHWQWLMEQWPTWATRLGDHRYDDRLDDRSRAAFAARAEHRAALLQQALEIDGGRLSQPDRTTLQLFVGGLQDEVGEEVCRFAEWSVSARYNALVRMKSMVDLHPRDTPHDHDTLGARLAAVPTMVEQEIEQLRHGMEQGRVANQESIRRVIEMTDTWLALAREDYEVVLLPRLDALRVAFASYRSFLHDELLPAGRGPDAVGLAHLAIGEACYAAVIATYTNDTLDPAAIHQTGADELATIHDEFRELGQRLWGTDHLEAIFERLRTDPELYFADEQEIEDKARSALARADKAIPKAFGRTPKAECTVERIPEIEAPYTTIAYYRRAAPDGSRPGTYFVNTYEPTTRPRHEAEVLAFHESIPGHHLQLSIAQELGSLPAFRRHTGATAYIEGWGLYTERLSDELGLYSGDLDRMGMLSFDSWRASRLVVDTGLHHFGWSRQKAIDFLTKNTPLPLNNIDNEVDRYITNPGQALAYKIGQLEILRLRAEAEATLGRRFDLRAFHDALLGGGAVRLPVLRARMGRWLQEQAR